MTRRAAPNAKLNFIALRLCKLLAAPHTTLAGRSLIILTTRIQADAFVPGYQPPPPGTEPLHAQFTIHPERPDVEGHPNIPLSPSEPPLSERKRLACNMHYLVKGEYIEEYTAGKPAEESFKWIEMVVHPSLEMLENQVK